MHRTKIALGVHSVDAGKDVERALNDHDYKKFVMLEDIWGRFDFYEPK